MVDPSLLTFFDGEFESNFDREFAEHLAEGRSRKHLERSVGCCSSMIS